MVDTPMPDANGYWHYTYVTYHPDTFEWYGGKHTTNNLNDGYLGSGNWIRWYPLRHELILEIVEFYNSEIEAYSAEAKLVTWEIIDNDLLCKNERNGGYGMTGETRNRLLADPKFILKYQKSIIKRPANPEWQRKHREMLSKCSNKFRIKHMKGIAKRTVNPEWQRKHREMIVNRSNNPEWQRKHCERLDIHNSKKLSLDNSAMIAKFLQIGKTISLMDIPDKEMKEAVIHSKLTKFGFLKTTFDTYTGQPLTVTVNLEKLKSIGWEIPKIIVE